MTPDEVLLIEGFDSLTAGRARFTPTAHWTCRTPPHLLVGTGWTEADLRRLKLIK